MKKKYFSIYDNIYGYIRLEKEVFKDILEDPFFLRLHDIKQLGLTYYIFPDALHTRFSHSLGVFSIIKRIMKSQSIERPELVNIHDDDSHDNNGLTILMSALLHDIGHLPLSHTVESALNKYRKEREQKEANKTDKRLLNEVIDNENQNNKTHSLTDDVKLHEELGELVIKKTPLSETIDNSGLNEYKVTSGFKGLTDEIETEKSPDYSKCARNFLHSQLDADRLDYLLRDSNFTGVKSGAFDFDKLMDEIRYDLKGNYGVNKEGVRALEQYLLARYSAYTQIVFNKKVHSLDYMASDFYYRMLKLRDKLGELPIRDNIYSFKDIKMLLEKGQYDKFLNFTDDYFQRVVNQVHNNSKIQDKIIKKYANLLTNRQPLKIVDYEEYFADPKEYDNKEGLIKKLQNKENQEKLAKAANVSVDAIIIPEKPLKFDIFDNEKDPIKIFDDDKIIKQNITECEESILKLINKKTLFINRIFTFDESRQKKLKNALDTIDFA